MIETPPPETNTEVCQAADEFFDEECEFQKRNILCTLCSEEFANSDQLWIHIHVHAEQIALSNSRNFLAIADTNTKSPGCALVLSFLELLEKRNPWRQEESSNLCAIEFQTFPQSTNSGDFQKVSKQSDNVNVIINLNNTESSTGTVQVHSRETIETISQPNSSETVSKKYDETCTFNVVININGNAQVNRKEQPEPIFELSENSSDTGSSVSMEGVKSSARVNVATGRKRTWQGSKEFESSDSRESIVQDEETSRSSNANVYQSDSTDNDNSWCETVIGLSDVEESDNENVVSSTKSSVQDSEYDPSLVDTIKSRLRKINTNALPTWGKGKRNFHDAFGESDEGHEDRQTVTDPLKILCETCQAEFATKHELDIHMQAHEVDTSSRLQCLSCDEGFYSLYDLQQHFKIHKNEYGDGKSSTCHSFSLYDLKCQIITFKEKGGKIDTLYFCNQCMKSVTTFQFLKIDFCHHAGRKPYSCRFCEKRYYSSTSLKYHLNLHTGSRPYACNVCNESFHTPRLLRTHHLKHNNPFWCNICKGDPGKMNAKSKLNELVCKHQEHNLLRCDVCSRSYTSSEYLKRHQRLVHGERKSMSCEECGMTFVTSKGYEMHKQQHKEKRFVCEVCKMGFARRDLLKKHLLVHVESPYSCHICSKPFREPDGLRRHAMTHSSEKPFQCQVCGKSFARSNSLKCHEYIHKDVKPFECEFCKKKFRHSTSVRRHRRTCAENNNKHHREKCDALETDTITGVESIASSSEDNVSIKTDDDIPSEDECSDDEKPFLDKARSNKKPEYSECQSSSTKIQLARLVEPHFTRSSVKRLLSEVESTGNRSDKIESAVKVIVEPQKVGTDLVLAEVNANDGLLPSSTSSNQKPFVCPVCKKTFSEKAYLTKHCNVHNSIRPHKCPFCPQTFKHYNSSKRHRSKCVYSKGLSEVERQARLTMVRLRKESKSREEYFADRTLPFPCQFCYKTFAHRENLNSHMLIHDNVKPYECEFCHQAFRHATSRRRHRKICAIARYKTSMEHQSDV